MKRRFRYGQTCSTVLLIMLIAAFGRIAHAGLIATECDPGPVGGLAVPGACDGVAFVFNPLSPDPVIDVVFTEMKHIEFFTETNSYFDFYHIFFNSPLTEPVNPTFQSTYYGIDEFGNNVITLGEITYLGLQNVFAVDSFNPDTIGIDTFIHGLRIDLSNALDGAGIWEEGTSGVLSISDTHFDGRFPEVGEWAVPEPATLALLSLGLVGLGFTRRKTRA